MHSYDLFAGWLSANTLEWQRATPTRRLAKMCVNKHLLCVETKVVICRFLCEKHVPCITIPRVIHWWAVHRINCITVHLDCGQRQRIMQSVTPDCAVLTRISFVFIFILFCCLFIFMMTIVIKALKLLGLFYCKKHLTNCTSRARELHSIMCPSLYDQAGPELVW